MFPDVLQIPPRRARSVSDETDDSKTQVSALAVFLGVIGLKRQSPLTGQIGLFCSGMSCPVLPSGAQHLRPVTVEACSNAGSITEWEMLSDSPRVGAPSCG